MPSRYLTLKEIVGWDTFTKVETMHRYRTHNCNELRPENVGETARLSGWIHRRRDHGQLVFLDLRDHFGITQCVVDIEDKSFSDVEKVRVESVVTICLLYTSDAADD